MTSFRNKYVCDEVYRVFRNTPVRKSGFYIVKSRFLHTKLKPVFSKTRRSTKMTLVVRPSKKSKQLVQVLKQENKHCT